LDGAIYACEYRPLKDEEKYTYEPMHANPYFMPPPHHDRKSERGRTTSNEGRSSLANTVGKWELEVGGHELLNVWAADIIGLGELNNAEDLEK